MKNKDTDTGYQKAFRVRDQKSEIVKSTIESSFLLRHELTIFIQEVFKSHL